MEEHPQHMQMQQQQHMPPQTADLMQIHGGMMQMAAGAPFAGPMQQQQQQHQQQQQPLGSCMFMGAAGGMH